MIPVLPKAILQTMFKPLLSPAALRSKLIKVATAALVLMVAISTSSSFSGSAHGALPFNTAKELSNFQKVYERRNEFLTPSYQDNLARISAKQLAAAKKLAKLDRERNFFGNLCWHQIIPCAGDARLHEWAESEQGTKQAVLFTARNGATLSGHIWRANRFKGQLLPGIVFANGGQANEEMYWWAAQTLASNGYQVMTYDPQGQGRSDTFGISPDIYSNGNQTSFSPSSMVSDTNLFYDNLEDALDFFFSTPDNLYTPRPSCGSGTVHSSKQQRRVRDGFNPAFNPNHSTLDSTKVGVAGHSFGAHAVSYVGQSDPRVKAIVALDYLEKPTNPSVKTKCTSNPTSRQPQKITKPGLGISADYHLMPIMNTAQPNWHKKAEGSHDYSSVGVDNGQITIRGGTHYEWSYSAIDIWPLGRATKRGLDISAWYMTAWFDKYLKGSSTADRRLMTTRWTSDKQSAYYDPKHDGNVFSELYQSRLDIKLADGEARWACNNLRETCTGSTSDDVSPTEYNFLDQIAAAGK